MILYVNLGEKSIFIPMVMQVHSKLSIFLHKFSFPPNTFSQLVMVDNEKYEENIAWEWTFIIMGGLEDGFHTQITLKFHSHYHYLLPTTQRVVNASYITLNSK